MSVCPVEIGNPSWSASAWVLAASTTDGSGRQNGQTRAGLGVGECTGTMGFLNEACGDEQADVVFGGSLADGLGNLSGETIIWRVSRIRFALGAYLPQVGWRPCQLSLQWHYL
jgi:hypothetical protein